MGRLAFVISVLMLAGCGAGGTSAEDKAKRWTQEETQQNVNFCIHEPSDEGFQTFVCDYGDSDDQSDGADDYTFCLVDVSDDGTVAGQCPFLKKENENA